MMIDTRVSVSLAGKEWMTQYLKENDLEIRDMKTRECNQVYEVKKYDSKGWY